jgi:hypothetical protein
MDGWKAKETTGRLLKYLHHQLNMSKKEILVMEAAVSLLRPEGEIPARSQPERRKWKVGN